MKKLLLLSLACAALATSLSACKKDAGNGKLDANAKVYISPAPGVRSLDVQAAGQTHLSAIEIVKQAELMYSTLDGMQLEMHIMDLFKDYKNVRFVGSSSWVIMQNGELETNLIRARDYLFTSRDAQKLIPIDTIAYIPNAVMIDAEIKIRAAFSAGDFAACYRLFEEAFVFKPT
ncbi:MAG: hypothetical protein RR066_04825, partial [Mucinivorans sp.]